MTNTTTIHVFDKVGLGEEAIKGSLLDTLDKFIYHAPADAVRDLRALVSQKSDAYSLLLVDPISLHRILVKMPESLNKRMAIAVMASPHELDDIQDYTDYLQVDEVTDIVEAPITHARLNILLRRAEIHFQHQANLDMLQRELMLQRDELQKLNEIGISLSSERNITKLLDLILSKSMEITSADAGSLYIVEDITDVEEDPANYFHNKHLKCKHTKNYSKEVPFKEFTMPISPNSIAGYVAFSGKPLNLPDVYNIPKGVPYGFGGRKFDEAIGYRTMSMLVVPMLNRNNETIGVIQLINKKSVPSASLSNTEVTERIVIPFNKVDDDFIYSLASQAAVAYENQILFEAHKNLLDAFIRVIADAIDKKSPYTGGHCNRVPILTEMLTRAACESNEAPFDLFNLTREQWYELHIAAWLHDCGKVITPPHVMDKRTKLETIYDRIHTVRMKFEVLMRDAEIHYLRALLSKESDPEQLEKVYKAEVQQLEDQIKFLEEINIGGEFLADQKIRRLEEIARKQICIDGKERALLSEEEVHNLSIRKGTLTDEERKEINDHIIVTIDMLEKLPFPRSLMRVPEYAGGHHEKMDGTGYPKGLTREQMSIPARIMAIADVFEALTAEDRPYKKGKMLSEAMRIMGHMKADNHLDPDLFNLFVKTGIYRQYAEKYMSPELIDEVDENALLRITPKSREPEEELERA